MDKLEVGKEVKEALDVIRSTNFPLYNLLSRESTTLAVPIRQALDVLYNWTVNHTTQEDEELALRYILGEDTVKVKPAEFKLLKGATITLGTGDVVTLSKDLTVQGNIKG